MPYTAMQFPSSGNAINLVNCIILISGLFMDSAFDGGEMLSNSVLNKSTGTYTMYDYGDKNLHIGSFTNMSMSGEYDGIT